MLVTRLTDKQLGSISLIERVCSVFSLMGCLFIIATFCVSKYFHKPINRLVFYASFGNMMTNVGTLMARTYIESPDSAGCQFQAFLIQMFMPADAFWTLAMAINVYMTFYFKYDAEKLRKAEIPYLLICYGIPFIVALIYVFIRSPERGRMYGDATLWCWVTTGWDVWRIATFYAPVWVAILLTVFIYTRAGREIYRRRKQLHNFSLTTDADHPLPVLTDPFTSTKTTEVYVTTEVIHQAGTSGGINLAALGARGAEAQPRSEAPDAAYSVTISSDQRAGPPEPTGDTILPIQTGSPVEGETPAPKQTGPNPIRRRAAYEANNAAWSYTKVAMLFFTALLVTWIPSSANRVYSVVHGGSISVPLEFMSAFVLPLQGFWNAWIYILTSWTACKLLWDDICHLRRPQVNELVGFRPNDVFRSHQSRSTRSDKMYESESMTELQLQTRSNSNDQGQPA